ncbi:zinc ribbon domain-containing protein, partial [candidate division KSB1 bacterium]|nr:zinc ribbon domain-containing protein [candidate division KSB1 bacterium]
MPTYDYDCSSCGRTTEIFQSITAPPVEKCPH